MKKELKTICYKAFKWLAIFTFINMLFQDCSFCKCIPDFEIGFPLKFKSFISVGNTYSEASTPTYEINTSFINLIANYLFFFIIAIIHFYIKSRKQAEKQITKQPHNE